MVVARRSYKVRSLGTAQKLEGKENETEGRKDLGGRWATKSLDREAAA